MSHTASARRLSAMIWKARLRTAFYCIAACIVIGVVTVLLIRNDVVRTSTVIGEVYTWNRTQNDAGIVTFTLGVKLPDGTSGVVTTRRYDGLPKNGDRVELTKLETASGKPRYRFSKAL
jgi:hypothetical protein